VLVYVLKMMALKEVHPYLEFMERIVLARIRTC